MRRATRAIGLRIGLGGVQVHGSSGRTPRIALVDGPVSASCPALARASLEWAALDEDFDVAPSAGDHATLMASVVAGAGDGLLGLCPDATLISIPAVSAGMLRAEDPDRVAGRVERAIGQALARRADVILLGIEFVGGPPSLAARVGRAIDVAAERGVRVVLPAGNTGLLHAPIEAGGAIPAVPADGAGRPLRQATLGPGIGARGLLAPGVAIPAMGPNGALTLQAGSSFAAAMVAGAFCWFIRQVQHIGANAIWWALGGGGAARHSSLVPRALDVTEAFQLLVGSY
jgi:hypothetical protein